MATFADSFAQRESIRPFDDDDSYAGYYSQPFDDSLATGDDVLESHQATHGQFSPQENGEFGGLEGRVSLSPSETEADQGFALIEWRSPAANRRASSILQSLNLCLANGLGVDTLWCNWTWTRFRLETHPSTHNSD
ncbi:hypothetical protein OIU76_013334 [Salix suchowensis]|nr:hypothetical protein OIU76_013334 [Salix suchowensis]